MSCTKNEANEIEEWLGSDDLDKLLAAKERLNKLGPEAVTILQTFAHRDADKYRASKRRLWCLSALAAVLCCVLFGHAVNSWPAPEAATYLLMPVWLMTPFFLFWFSSHRTCQKRLNHTTVLLRSMTPVAAVSELIEVLALGDSDSSYLAARSLTDLLPRLKPTDGVLLQERHHAYLHHALRGHDSYLIIAILKALEAIGNHRDMAEVQRLIGCPQWVAESPRIRAAAQRCLSILQVRADEMRPAQTFLRMASAPTGDSLLRAASETTVEDSQQLLRAGMMQEPEK